MTSTLRPYQHQALNAIAAAHAAGQNRLLVQSATGTGKTQVFASLTTHPQIAAWLASFPTNSRKVLVIAHREELIDQAAARMQQLNPGILVSIEQGERHANHYSDVVIASIQTLSAMKFKRLRRLLARNTFRIVICDESHHCPSPTYRTALVHLGFLPPADASDRAEVEAANFDDVAVMQRALEGWDAVAPKDRLLVGVTATPNRTDAIGLGCVFQSLVYTYPIKQAIEDTYLVPIVPWVVETRTDLDAVRVTAGEFNQKDLAAAVNTTLRNELAVAAWFEHAMGLSTIAFTVTVEHAHGLAAEFTRNGAKAVALSGETPKEERRQILRDYTDGKVQVICNCMVLTEGTDLPLTGCILHAKPTKSATLYEQMTGRGLRTHPLKDRCVVIDVVDIARRHSLQTAPVLYGLPPGLLVNGRPLGDAENDLEKLREQFAGFDIDAALAQGRLTLEQLQARASTFSVWDILPIGAALGSGRALEWVKVGEDRYRLSYPWADAGGADGTETLEIGKDMLGQFEIVLTWREKLLGISPYQKTPIAPGHRAPGTKAQVRQRTIGAHIAKADEAAGIAEAFVLSERREVQRLKAHDAPWQKRPASEKQINYLRRLRVPFKEPITMGQAGQLITMAMARRGAGGRR